MSTGGRAKERKDERQTLLGTTGTVAGVGLVGQVRPLEVLGGKRYVFASVLSDGVDTEGVGIRLSEDGGGRRKSGSQDSEAGHDRKVTEKCRMDGRI